MCGGDFEVGGRDANGNRLPNQKTQYCGKQCASRTLVHSGKECLLLSPCDARTTAQFFDGEGSAFAIENGRSRALLFEVSIGNSDQGILQWIADKTGLGNTVPRKSTLEGYATIHIWRCYSKGAISLLKQVFPLLEIKKPIADLLIRAWDAIQAHPQIMYDTVWKEELLASSKKLNQRGPEGSHYRAEIKARYPELRGDLINRCSDPRTDYEPTGVLRITEKLAAQQPDDVAAGKPAWRRCPVCGTEFPIIGLITTKKPFTTCSRKCAYIYRGRTTKPCLVLEPEIAGALASLVDGEGYIRVRRSYATVVAEVGFGNTDRSVVSLFQAATGAGVVDERPPEKTTHSTSFHWRCVAQAAQGLLEQILPYLQIKRRQGELALYVQERRMHAPSRYDRSWQAEVLVANQRLNAKGKKRAVPPITLGDGLLII